MSQGEGSVAPASDRADVPLLRAHVGSPRTEPPAREEAPMSRNASPAGRVPLSVRDRAASTGATTGFERYVLPELDVLLRVATSITHDPVDAEDLVQETLIRAHKAIDRFDGRHPRAWLFTIMRNAQRNRIRRRRPELLRNPDSDMERLGPVTEPRDEPEGQVVDVVFEPAVQTAYEELPDRFRKVVELVDLGGLAYQEASRCARRTDRHGHEPVAPRTDPHQEPPRRDRRHPSGKRRSQMSVLADLFGRQSPGGIDCRRVARALQAVLDGEDDRPVADRVAVHLEDCRRCGLEADTYLRIKASLNRQGHAPIDQAALRRLRRFGDQLLDR